MNGDTKFTTREAAEYVGLAESTLTTWRCTRRQAIPFLKLGKKVLYRRRDLDRWLEQQTVGAVDAD